MTKLYNTDTLAHSLHLHMITLQVGGKTFFDIYSGTMPKDFTQPIAYPKLLAIQSDGQVSSLPSGLRYYTVTNNIPTVALATGKAAWAHVKIGTWELYTPVHESYVRLSSYNIVAGQSYTLVGFKIRVF